MSKTMNQKTPFLDAFCTADCLVWRDQAEDREREKERQRMEEERKQEQERAKLQREAREEVRRKEVWLGV